MAAEETDTLESGQYPVRNEGTQETSYTIVRVLGRGAFGEAVLYRKTEVSTLLFY